MVHPETVLGWDLDTISHLLRLPPIRWEKLADVLAVIPQEARTTYLRKWSNLLGLIRRITPAGTVSRSTFT